MKKALALADTILASSVESTVNLRPAIEAAAATTAAHSQTVARLVEAAGAALRAGNHDLCDSRMAQALAVYDANLISSNLLAFALA